MSNAIMRGQAEGALSFLTIYMICHWIFGV